MPSVGLSGITCSNGSSRGKKVSGECAGCGRAICERYYLLAVDRAWHTACLRCCECARPLECELTCFSKDGAIYCKRDYYRRFSVQRCARCHLGIAAAELVMRARAAVYHVACFTCSACSGALEPGEPFSAAPCAPHRLYCRHHLVTVSHPHPPHTALGCTNENDEGGGDLQGGRDGPASSFQSSSQKSKRMRTSFKHHQLRTMKSYFALNHNPDAKDLKQLAQKTGLTKRVLQVWFQNARAKFRRNLLRQESGGGASVPGGGASVPGGGASASGGGASGHEGGASSIGGVASALGGGAMGSQCPGMGGASEHLPSMHGGGGGGGTVGESRNILNNNININNNNNSNINNNNSSGVGGGGCPKLPGRDVTCSPPPAHVIAQPMAAMQLHPGLGGNQGAGLGGNQGAGLGNQGAGLGNQGAGLGNHGAGLGNQGAGLGNQGAGLGNQGAGLGGNQGAGLGNQGAGLGGIQGAGLAEVGGPQGPVAVASGGSSATRSPAATITDLF
ncbi:uncharacterized protein LOC144953863 [Lampetra fluviatilis]